MTTLATCLTPDQRRHLAEIAAAPLPTLRPCSDGGFDRCMGALNVLHKRNSGTDEAEVMLGVYRRQLGHLPSAQLVWMVDTAIARLKWFPTPSELLEIAAEWRRDDEAVRAKARAEIALRNDRQARYDAAMAALRRGEMDAAAIAALPLPWAEAAVRLGWLVRVESGFAYPQPVVEQEGEAA